MKLQRIDASQTGDDATGIRQADSANIPVSIAAGCILTDRSHKIPVCTAIGRSIEIVFLTQPTEVPKCKTIDPSDVVGGIQSENDVHGTVSHPVTVACIQTHSIRAAAGFSVAQHQAIVDIRGAAKTSASRQHRHGRMILQKVVGGIHRGAAFGGGPLTHDGGVVLATARRELNNIVGSDDSRLGGGLAETQHQRGDSKGDGRRGAWGSIHGVAWFHGFCVLNWYPTWFFGGVSGDATSWACAAWGAN